MRPLNHLKVHPQADPLAPSSRLLCPERLGGGASEVANMDRPIRDPTAYKNKAILGVSEKLPRFLRCDKRPILSWIELAVP